MRAYFAVQINDSQLESKNAQQIEQILKEELKNVTTLEVASYDKNHRNAIRLAKSLPPDPNRPHHIIFSARVPDGKYFQTEPKATTEQALVDDIKVDIARYYQNGNFKKRVGKRVSRLNLKLNELKAQNQNRISKFFTKRRLLIAGAVLLGVGAAGLAASFSILAGVSYMVKMALGALAVTGLGLLGASYFVKTPAKSDNTTENVSVEQSTSLLDSLKRKLGYKVENDLAASSEVVLDSNHNAAIINQLELSVNESDRDQPQERVEPQSRVRIVNV